MARIARLVILSIVVGGFVLVPKALTNQAAGAGPAKLGGIHIHGSLKQTAGAIPLTGRLIDVNVWGTDDDLSGFGWDANPAAAGGPQPGEPDVTQCYFTQRGSVQGDAVHLTGRNLFAAFPPEVGHLVTVEANLATGQVKWTDGEGSNAFVFEGTGVVGRI